MGFSVTMIFYLLIGLGVATAVFLADSRQSGGSAAMRVAMALVFWPLYLPILLSKPRSEPIAANLPDTSDGDAMAQAIAQVEAELDLALASLDGWVEDVLAHENDRFHELSAAWRVQADRIREMDRLIARAGPAVSGPEANDRCRSSEQSRRANLDRLRQVRGRAYDDLMGTLAWVRELVSMIHLAKFTGAPASRAEELVAQIATAIEGISAVTWQDAKSDFTVRPSWPAPPNDFRRGDSSMRLFRRIGDIVAANLNDLVDRFEDPDVMLKQAIREMETMIEHATASAARAIAAERLLARDLSDHQEKARRWNARAEEAIRNGDDNLGRQAIGRALEHEALLLTLAEQQSSAERTAQALRGQIQAMRAKQAEARRKLASLSGRRQMVEAGRALRGSTGSSTHGADGFARYERMSQRIDQADAEAHALAELYESPESRWETETESREQARRVDAELAAIKQRLQTAQPPL